LFRTFRGGQKLPEGAVKTVSNRTLCARPMAYSEGTDKSPALAFSTRYWWWPISIIPLRSTAASGQLNRQASATGLVDHKPNLREARRRKASKRLMEVAGEPHTSQLKVHHSTSRRIFTRISEDRLRSTYTA